MQYLSIMDDGIQLRAVLERPDQERRPLVIVLHGFTSSKDRAHTVAACEAMSISVEIRAIQSLRLALFRTKTIRTGILDTICPFSF